jgi:hypothetical protein
MRCTWKIIGVGDVAGSFNWYQSLLGLPERVPAHGQASCIALYALLRCKNL